MLTFVKRFGKTILTLILEWHVRRLKVGNDFTIIAVAGSVGKTSTKLAIANLLSAHRTVRFQDGNYNDRLTVPLVFFGHAEPSIFNVVAWIKLLLDNERQLRQPYNFDTVVIELGTDGPGQLKDFAYLKPNIAVITAIAAEHMEYFGTIDAVAKEELTVAEYAKTLLVNIDDCDSEYIGALQFLGYGTHSDADFHISGAVNDIQSQRGQALRLSTPHGELAMNITLLGEPGAKAAAAACAVAALLNIPIADIEDAVTKLTAPAGRMRLLKGRDGVTIIDDTYNASPIAVMAALDVLHAMDAPQKIAVLGSMNEMGTESESMHESVGLHCAGQKSGLDLVITVGAAAREYLAPAAKRSGCKVEPFDSPYAAAAFLQEVVKPGAVVLAKGSQNGVFAEEAIRPLLADAGDAAKLVRQSPHWQAVKRSQFDDYTV